MVYKKKVFALTFMTGYKTFVTGNNGCLDVASVKKRIENVAVADWDCNPSAMSKMWSSELIEMGVFGFSMDNLFLLEFPRSSSSSQVFLWMHGCLSDQLIFLKLARSLNQSVWCPSCSFRSVCLGLLLCFSSELGSVRWCCSFRSVRLVLLLYFKRYNGFSLVARTLWNWF